MREEHILKLKPVIKEAVWGGTKLRDKLNKDRGKDRKIAESWEVSTHFEGQNTIDGDEFSGITLGEYFEKVGWEKTLGEYGKKNSCLPVLVKYIDAHENLSIQVHPDDEYALKHEHDSGKSEIWYVLDAEKGAFVYLGFNRDVNKEELVPLIEEGKICEVLNKVPVKKGETYFIPAGTVHAIGKGCLLCEIQQTSNLTYRIYDYDRVDSNGNKRELSFEKALEVLNFKAFNVGENRVLDIEKTGKFLRKMLSQNAACSIMKYDGTGEFSYTSTRQCIKFVLFYDGKGKIMIDSQTENAVKGDTFLVNSRSIKLSGKCKAMIIKM